MRKLFLIASAALLTGACAGYRGDIARYDLHWGQWRPHHPAQFEAIRERQKNSSFAIQPDRATPALSMSDVVRAQRSNREE